jgi:hypothetical protein
MMSEPSKEELDAAVKAAAAGGEETGTEIPGEPTPEYSEVELEAIEQGWNPEGVEGKRNLTAEEFLDRKPLYDDLRKTKRQIRKQQEQLEALKKHVSIADERARERALRELDSQKREALEDQNFDAVIAIDKQIRETENAPLATETPTNAAFENWREENDWYDEDAELKDYADMVGTHFAQRHPEKPVSEVFEHVTKEVKARYASKFKNERREQPNPVEGAVRGRAAGSKQKHSERDLPEEHRQIMNTLVKGGTMTKDEYLKSYFGD